MTPDLEMVRIPDDASFKAWSHGYPFRTVRWHFHPEYELHLVTRTHGHRYVGDHVAPFAPGDLVLVGPNVPHNWISDVPSGESVDERCVILQFTDDFIDGCMRRLPELQALRPLLSRAQRGLLFPPEVAARVGPLLRGLLDAPPLRRVALFMQVLDEIGSAKATPLASIGHLADTRAFRSATMNLALEHIGRNFTQELGETQLAALCRQSASSFSRAFVRHTGVTFVHYVNALRVELACQHLGLAALSITDICYEVGFRNVSNFNRQFLAIKGMSPSRFRALQHAGRSLARAA